jgi:hypothetical protein
VESKVSFQVEEEKDLEKIALESQSSVVDWCPEHVVWSFAVFMDHREREGHLVELRVIVGPTHVVVTLYGGQVLKFSDFSQWLKVLFKLFPGELICLE